MGMYSDERNVQILIAVLKANHIRKVIVSPGATNISLVASLANDGSFEMYSAVDERGAAYIACGLSSESGEPVMITCTGATASRNYFPALSEAYHRKLPILAVTASQDFIREGNLSPQYVDRNGHPNDSLRLSVQVPVVRNAADDFLATLRINKAVLELCRHGGGPVHINLASSYTNTFETNSVSNVRVFRRFGYEDALPPMPAGRRIAIAVGNHKQWSRELTEAVDRFCGIYDAVVVVDHSSHYWGKYRILPTIVSTQEQYQTSLFDIDLLIHLGQEHGDYYTDSPLHKAKEVWRVNEDGEIRDTFGKLTNTFEMSALFFFRHYTEGAAEASRHDYLDAFRKETAACYALVPDLPLSNIWIAQQVIPRFPSDACLELGVSNTMRAWTFFDFREETYVLANTGCRGIDGAIPTLLGMSLADPDRLHFAVMGDLTFFYSFNVLGNRHVGRNLRILLVNNGCGAEFNLYQHRAYKVYNGDGQKINEFVGGGGHTGTRSKQLVKHFAEDLGFRYMTASSKEEFTARLPEFLEGKMDQPVIFEVFTRETDESDALKLVRRLKTTEPAETTGLKSKLKSLLGR